MQVGQRVIIKETNEKGVVESVNERGVPMSVKLDTGNVIDTLNHTVEILTIVNAIVGLFKSIWKSIKGK